MESARFEGPSADEQVSRHLYLEHDGKLLLVDADGNGPQKPVRGRESKDGWLLRLPTEAEATAMGIPWTVKRTNRFRLGDDWHEVTHAVPDIEWPKEWAWKDNVISDSAVHPVVRDSVYRTLHRIVAKVVLRNPSGEVLLQKVKRGFFTGQWSLPGGFVDYGEHPREGAARELAEELGLDLCLSDPSGEAGEVREGEDMHIVQERIFTAEGINFVSFSYLVDVEHGLEFTLKPDEIEDARWFSPTDAMARAASLFDLEAMRMLTEE